MKKLFLVSTLAITAVLFTGCIAQSVPRLKLTVDMKTGQVSLTNPKDTTIRNYETVISTNGSVTVKFESLTTVMNPDVITTTGDAQSKMIAATGKVVMDAISTAGTAAATSGVSTLLPK